jgi:Reverse transcriptase (RNA-dependent DNA polymerase)
MNAISELLKHCCVVYTDAILVFSSTLEERALHLKQVLEAFREHRLFAKLSKCEFARREMPFLGFIASAEGLHVHPAKVAAVEQWPTHPKKELKKKHFFKWLPQASVCAHVGDRKSLLLL